MNVWTHTTLVYGAVVTYVGFDAKDGLGLIPTDYPTNWLPNFTAAAPRNGG